MRFLHLSDLHIGKRVNEFSMLEDQRHILGQVVDLVGERGVDAVVVAGDLYDKSTPSAEAVALLDWFLDALVSAGTQVIATAGNHDSAERVAYASALLARQGVHLSPVYDGRVERVDVPDEHGAVSFWLVPFLKPSMVRPFFPDEPVETYTDALRVALGACELDPDARNVAVSHQFVTACGAVTERTDSELVLGGVDNVDVGVYDAFDYVALGHVHRAQRVGRDTVRYCGSPLKYSIGEARGGSKSVPLVEMGPKGQVAVELVELHPLHDVREVRGPLADLVAPHVVSAADPNDYLHVVLTDEQPVLDALARLRAVFPNVMAVEYDNARTRATGRPDVGAPGPGQVGDPFELFSAFYERQNGASLSAGQEAVVRAAFEKAQVM